MDFFEIVEIGTYSIDPDIPIGFLLIIAGTSLVLEITKRLFAARLKKTHVKVLSFTGKQIGSITHLTPIIIGLYLATQIIETDFDFINDAARILFIVILIYELFDILIAGINHVVKDLSAKAPDKTDITMYRFIGRVTKGIAVFLAFLLVLSNLGYNITSLIAGLGITGIAVALAVQAVLGDFISSISIVFDKPFKIDDFINFDGNVGQVKQIGIKSTRIQSIEGEEIIVPNAELSKTLIRNYGRVQSRRSLHTIGVEYSTPGEKLKIIPELIGKIVEKNHLVGNDTYRINLVAFGDFSINFEVVFYVLTSDYDEFLEVQEQVLLEIYDVFEKEAIKFAFPTQVVNLKQQDNT